MQVFIRRSEGRISVSSDPQKAKSTTCKTTVEKVGLLCGWRDGLTVRVVSTSLNADHYLGLAKFTVPEEKEKTRPKKKG